MSAEAGAVTGLSAAAQVKAGRSLGMVGEWRGCTIGELCDAGLAELQTGPFGTQLHAHDYVENGVPVVPTEANGPV